MNSKINKLLNGNLILIIVVFGGVLFGFNIDIASANTGINPQIPYSGSIVKNDGTLLNGTYRAKFVLYNVSSGGTSIYEEIRDGSTTYAGTGVSPSLSVSDGKFEILLGSQNTALATLNDDSLWLELQLDMDNNGVYEEIFSPRKRIGSAVSAINSLRLVAANGGTDTDTLSLDVSGNVIATSLGGTANAATPLGFDRVLLANSSGQFNQVSLSSLTSGNLTTSTGWALAGNSTTDAWNGTSGSRIGTTSAQPLVLATTNATAQDIRFFTGANGANERMRIGAGGGVAIGGTDFRGVLTVQSNFATPVFTANTDMGDAGRTFVMQNNNTTNAANQFSNITLQINPTGVIGSGRVLGDIRLVRETANQTNSYFLFSAYRQEGYRDFSKIAFDSSYFAGNLGIGGTTTPIDRLHVLNGNIRVDSSTGSIAFWSGAGYFGGIGVSGGMGGSGTDIILRAEPNRSLMFQTNGANERLRILSDGTVGIGTTAATAQLHIVGSAGATLTTSPGGGARESLRVSGGTGGGTSITTTGTGGNGGAITLGTGNGGVANAALTASTGGTGGTYTITGGTGGAATVAGTGTNTGGVGGAFAWTAGTGGAATGASSGTNTGGNGGAVGLTAGTGGAANTGTGTNAGGAGGTLTLSGGTGGIGATTSGNGGAAVLQGGAAAAAAGSAGGAATVSGRAGSSTGSGGAGGNASLLAGAAAGDGTVSRAGGAIAITAGASIGGAVGGAVSITAGVGGANITAGTATGGNGGGFTFTTGAGGITSAGATTASTGGAGGAYTINGGTGGATAIAGTGTNTGGAGGALTWSGGTGGAATGASSGTNTGGAGGNISLTAGTGGAANTGTGTNAGGAGGTLTLSGGVGGTATTPGIGGNIIFSTTPNNAAVTERLRIANSGFIGIGNIIPTTILDINGNALRLRTSQTPISNAACNQGEIAWDTDFIYVCTASSAWKRAALTAY